MEKRTIPSEIWVQLYSAIAGAMVEYSALDPTMTTDENGDERYTEEAQEKFNHCTEIAEEILASLFIKGE